MKYLCPRDFRRGEMEEYMSNTSISIESVENLLPKELLELLQPFQIEHGPSVDRRHKGLRPTYHAENISVDRWPAKLQRAEHRKAMHDQTDERQETIRCS